MSNSQDDRVWDHYDYKRFVQVYSQSRNFTQMITEKESSLQDASIPASRVSIRPAVQKLGVVEVRVRPSMVSGSAEGTTRKYT